MAHLNSAEGIQNMCATQIMTKSKSLRTGCALDQGLISCFQNASQTLISSRPNPTKKLGENPVPFHSRSLIYRDISLSIDIFFKDGVSKFLAQIHMRPKAHPVCLKAQRFIVILSAHK